MMKNILFIALIIIPLQLTAKDSGINFSHGTYEEALELAAKENKLVFIDWVTDWCGPCKMMARDVFPLEEVGQVYNQNFISLKLDAESEKYSPLAKHFKVKSYPTYLFIDPISKEIVHRSGSRQSAEDFLLTAKQAISPEYNSVSLTMKYADGVRNPEFMEQYVLYLKINYSKNLAKTFDEFMDLPSIDLSNKTAWTVFSQKINGVDNQYFKEVVGNPDKYKRLYQDEVDNKIEKEYSLLLQRAAHGCLYGGEEDDIRNYKEALKKANGSDFPNKELVIKQALAIYLLGLKEFDETHEIVVGVLSDDTYSFSQKKKYFNQFIGYAYALKDDPEYLAKMIVYARYFAYNADDKQDVSPHYKYAQILEKILFASNIQKDEYLTNEPMFGTKEYSLRPKDLKRKPQKKSR